MPVSIHHIHTSCNFRLWLILAALLYLPVWSLAQTENSAIFGTINIRSVPEGANVYFDSVLIGKTPIDQFKAAAGNHTMTFELVNYVTKETQILLKTGKPAAYSTVLMPAFGFLNVESVPPNARVEIDTSVVCTGDVNQAQISTGLHTVSIVDADAPDKISNKIKISSGIFYEYKFGSSLQAPIQSTLIPGLGQVMDGSYFKGILEFSATATAAYYMVKYITLSGRQERDFQTALTNYSLAANELDAITAHKTVSDAVTRLKRSQDIRSISKTVFIASYILTIVDAFVFHTSRHLILEREKMLEYPSLIDFSRSPAIRIGIHTTIN